MRILYFSKDYTPHDHRFLAALAQTEHEIYYLRLECGARQVEDRPIPSEVQQVHWRGGGEAFRWRDVPRLSMALTKLIRAIQPDLVHAGPIQTCAFVAALTGFHPLLTMSWGFDLMQDAERNRWWRGVTRYTLKRSDFFVSDAQVTRRKAVEYGMNPAHTSVFPWGVDLQHFRPTAGARSAPSMKRPSNAPRTARASHAAAKSPFILFCNRSWEPRYGVDVLAKAFVKVARSRDNVSLLLLGGGSMAQELRRILMQSHALERVQFGGQIPQKDLPGWYQMADLYISPSHVDGSSVSLMEALACGLPTLVSDIPANREWIRDGTNGWLFADGDVDGLASKIIDVADRREDLHPIRVAARKTAEQRANWRKNFQALLAAYERAVRPE